MRTEDKQANFEVFSRRHKQPTITTNYQGKIMFSRAAYDALGEAQAVLLKFDPQNRLIAVEPCDSSDNRAFPVRKLRKNNAHVYANAFLKHYGLNTDKTIKYEVEVQGKELIARV